MGKSRLWLWGILGSVVVVSVAVLLVVSNSVESSPVVQDNPSAPQPLSPPSGMSFVEPNIMLTWDWPPGLADNQMYVVRLGVDDQPPVEMWTGDTELDAQSAIDGFGYEVGQFTWQVAVVNTSANGFESMGSEWSPAQTMTRVRRIVPTPFAESDQSNSARYIASLNTANFTELIDAARHFVSSNTDSGAQDYGVPDRSVELEQMYAHQMGEGEQPRLFCDGASTAALTLLQQLGVESRLIFLYWDGSSGVGQHTLLEVFNPDTQYWEVHNILGDFYYYDQEAGYRVSIERLAFGSLDTIVACYSDGSCSRDEVEKHLFYFSAFRYGYSDTFWVNPDRFDVSKRFPDHDNRNLAELLTGNPRDFVFRFDSWQ